MISITNQSAQIHPQQLDTNQSSAQPELAAITSAATRPVIARLNLQMIPLTLDAPPIVQAAVQDRQPNAAPMVQHLPYIYPTPASAIFSPQNSEQPATFAYPPTPIYLPTPDIAPFTESIGNLFYADDTGVHYLQTPSTLLNQLVNSTPPLDQ